MDFKVRSVNEKYQELLITDHNITIESSFLDRQESIDVAIKLINATEELLSNSGLEDIRDKCSDILIELISETEGG